MYVAGSAAACRLLGCTSAELMALGPADIHPQIRFESRGDRPAGSWQRDNVLVMRPDKSTFVARISATAFHAGGRPYILETILDEAQMMKAAQEMLEPVGLLASGIAHEMRNSLTYVIYYLERLTDIHTMAQLQPERAPGSEEAPRLLMEIQSGIEAIRKMTEGMSVLSRAERLGEQPVLDVNEVVEFALPLVRHETKLQAAITLELDSIPLRVRAPRAAFTRILVGLLLRMVKTIEQNRLSGCEIQIRTWTSPGFACLRLHREGGERREESEFEPEAGAVSEVDEFLQQRRLTSCDEFVTKLGGRLEVELQDGLESTLTLRLPLDAAAPAADRRVAEQAAEEQKQARQRVLIVEDDPGVCEILRQMLARTNDVFAVNSGQEAQQSLSDGGFDVILSDIMMPGISGLDLRDWLAARDPEAADRLIFVTGGVVSEDAQRRLDELGNPRLYKPFREDEVSALVRQAAPPRPGAETGLESKS
jgi:CheY-like chemotaxis protein